jgi:hypothetical protein
MDDAFALFALSVIYGWPVYLVLIIVAVIWYALATMPPEET